MFMCVHITQDTVSNLVKQTQTGVQKTEVRESSRVYTDIATKIGVMSK